MVQWLRRHVFNAWGLGSISGQGTRPHVLQLKVRTLQLKILHAAMEIRGSHGGVSMGWIVGMATPRRG